MALVNFLLVSPILVSFSGPYHDPMQLNVGGVLKACYMAYQKCWQFYHYHKGTCSAITAGLVNTVVDIIALWFEQW